MSSEPNETAGLGHNMPPATYAPPSDLEKRLKETHSAAFHEVETWLASAAKAPEKIEDDETLGKFSTLVGKLLSFKSGMDKVREAEKLPYLTAGRVVDATFKSYTDRIEEAQESLEKRQKAYIRQKEAAARAKADQEAQEERERAEAALRFAEAAADRGDTDASMEKLNEAATAETAAQAAEAVAEAPAADLVRTHGKGGATVSAKVTWAYEIADLTKVPLEQLRPYFSAETIDKAVKAAVRAGVRQLEGVRIYEDRKVTNKRI